MDPLHPRYNHCLQKEIDHMEKENECDEHEFEFDHMTPTEMYVSYCRKCPKVLISNRLTF